MDTNSNPGDLNDAEAPFGQSPSGSGGSSPSASMMFSPLPESSTFPPFSYPGAFQLGTSSPPAELSDLSIDLSPFIEHPANIPEEVTSSAPALRPSHLVENPALPDSPVQPAFLIPRSVDSSPFLDQEPFNSPAQQMPLEDSVDESPFYEHADLLEQEASFTSSCHPSEFLDRPASVLDEEASSASSFHRSEFLDRPANYPDPEPSSFLGSADSSPFYDHRLPRNPREVVSPASSVLSSPFLDQRPAAHQDEAAAQAGPSASSLISSINESEEVPGVPTPGAFHLANIRETTGENLAFLPRPPNSDRGDADEGSNLDGSGPQAFVTLQFPRIDIEQIEGENWFSAGPNPDTTLQDVNNFLDRLETITTGPVSPEASTSQLPKCPICLEIYAEGDTTVALPCHESHQFHRPCIANWLRDNFICPLCRGPFDE
ncbi:hypothetical protein Pst134EA_015115 [Puccinia striiformis f. sp. tritici]|uniref:hypothetical protein n=1 Tax=Puccinia striiformis f. sp. tritici TaxID=168172 RepID=UPI00200829DA|nr:hypothetical protein Pst134EA_015115 [Puccinia striiformis f. sp. tritici]KAH9463027.1 hypothetical protein Pst134EA_015115 [Puccinia striiformis f. sp. tritici]